LEYHKFLLLTQKCKFETIVRLTSSPCFSFFAIFSQVVFFLNVFSWLKASIGDANFCNLNLDLFPSDFQGDMTSNITSVGEAESEPADPTSTLESARNIDARQLNLRYGFMAAVALVISTLAAIWFQNRQGQF